LAAGKLERICWSESIVMVDGRLAGLIYRPILAILEIGAIGLVGAVCWFLASNPSLGEPNWLDFNLKR
jgi:hypothetical protein